MTLREKFIYLIDFIYDLTNRIVLWIKSRCLKSNICVKAY